MPNLDDFIVKLKLDKGNRHFENRLDHFVYQYGCENYGSFLKLWGLNMKTKEARALGCVWHRESFFILKRISRIQAK